MDCSITNIGNKFHNWTIKRPISTLTQLIHTMKLECLLLAREQKEHFTKKSPTLGACKKKRSQDYSGSKHPSEVKKVLTLHLFPMLCKQGLMASNIFSWSRNQKWFSPPNKRCTSERSSSTHQLSAVFTTNTTFS